MCVVGVGVEVGVGVVGLVKKSVKIFCVSTEESEYIQAARRTTPPPVRGTLGTAGVTPPPDPSTHPLLSS